MVGQGVLRECLLDPEVESVLTVGRSATGQQHAKLQEVMHQDFWDFSAIDQYAPRLGSKAWAQGYWPIISLNSFLASALFP